MGARLEAVLELVPPGAVADIGAGDGRLALALAAAGHRVVATENKRGPLDVVRAALAGSGVEVRSGDGLAPIVPGEVDCVVIAGMGGHTMARVLADGAAAAARVDCFVLQPMQRLDALLGWLAANRYRVVERRDVTEGGKVYAALKCLPPYSRR